jgi:hypothetical protein
MMFGEEWRTLRAILSLSLLLGVAGLLRGGDKDTCGPKICCPVEYTKKETRVIYSEKVTEACFPPSPLARLKKCLGLGRPSGGPCDGCGGQPRAVHKLFKKIETQEKLGVKYEPVLCPIHP